MARKIVRRVVKTTRTTRSVRRTPVRRAVVKRVARKSVARKTTRTAQRKPVRRVTRKVATRRVGRISRYGEVKQHGTVGARYSRRHDAKIIARPAGWRMSSSGRRYYEARPNRSDVSQSRRL